MRKNLVDWHGSAALPVEKLWGVNKSAQTDDGRLSRVVGCQLWYEWVLAGADSLTQRRSGSNKSVCVLRATLRVGDKAVGILCICICIYIYLQSYYVIKYGKSNQEGADWKMLQVIKYLLGKFRRYDCGVITLHFFWSTFHGDIYIYIYIWNFERTVNLIE